MRLGFITLYAEGLRQWQDHEYTEWTVAWYYASDDKWRSHFYPDGKYYRRAWEPITPPPDYPVDLDNLVFKVNDYSEEEVCPHTGYKGACWWGPFGPFAVVDGEEYTINIRSGELAGPLPPRFSVFAIADYRKV